MAREGASLAQGTHHALRVVSLAVDLANEWRERALRDFAHGANHICIYAKCRRRK
jgi:hypothetical protein